MSNKSTWESDRVVSSYSIAEDLQKPELTILNKLKDWLNNKKMLDIGIGGGRTTLHFAELVNEYVGVDYAENMIEACKKKITQYDNTAFGVTDVRDLSEFADHSFDFVLFSFNGLDYISHDDRIKALKEIKRVLKKDGRFVFSTHNINAISDIYKVKISKKPVRMVRHVRDFFKLFVINGFPKKIKKMEWTIVNDGAHEFGLESYYIHPLAQIDQLKALNFRDIKTFSLNSGLELSESELHEIKDSWIYYMCHV